MTVSDERPSRRGHGQSDLDDVQLRVAQRDLAVGREQLRLGGDRADALAKLALVCGLIDEVVRRRGGLSRRMRKLRASSKRRATKGTP